jgi:hypothetical protein
MAEPEVAERQIEPVAVVMTMVVVMMTVVVVMVMTMVVVIMVVCKAGGRQDAGRSAL